MLASFMSNLRSGCHAIRILFLALFLPLLICANFSVAQQASTASNTGSIRGTVVDSKSAQPLNGATVALRSLHGGGGEGNSAVTASDGAFSFRTLLPAAIVLSHRTTDMSIQPATAERLTDFAPRESASPLLPAKISTALSCD